MKKIFITIVFATLAVVTMKAQDISKNTLGIRIGGDSQFGVGVNYQRALLKNNRLELELAWRNSSSYDAVKITGIYEWVWEIEGNFNWYAGAGLGIGSYSHNYYINSIYFKDSGSYGLITGNVGLEYNFNEFPIQLSLDFKPEIYLNSNYRNGIKGDFGLGIRYRF